MPPARYATAAAGGDWGDGRRANSSIPPLAARRRGRPGTPPIRVLIAEDVTVVRETLTAPLSLEPGLQVAAAVATGDQIMPAALRHRPDVALLDIGLPGSTG